MCIQVSVKFTTNSFAFAIVCITYYLLLITCIHNTHSLYYLLPITYYLYTQYTHSLYYLLPITYYLYTQYTHSL